MRKEWSNPEMEALEIERTAGGTVLTGEPDGNWVQDPETGIWWQPGGNDPISE